MSNSSYVQYIRFSFTVLKVIPEHNMRGKNPSSVQLQYASLPKRDSRNHARPRTYGPTGFVTHAYDMFKAENSSNNIKNSVNTSRKHFVSLL